MNKSVRLARRAWRARAYVLFGVVLTLAAVLGWLFRPESDTPSVSPSALLTAQSADEITPTDALEKLRAWLTESQMRIHSIKTYQCTLRCREVVGGTLMPAETFHLKVRHEPFSIYLNCTEPASNRGQEAIYVEGQNDGNLIAHLSPNAFGYSLFGTVGVSPLSYPAMHNRRYPITCTGIKYLVDRAFQCATKGLVEVTDAQIRFLQPSTVDHRKCTPIEIRYVRMRPEYQFRMCRIFFDEQLRIPVRLEAYADAEASDELKLLEEYSFMNLELDVPFSDEDFSQSNPNYAFP